MRAGAEKTMAARQGERRDFPAIEGRSEHQALPDGALDLAWGIDAIAAYIGRTRRQTYEALVKGQLPPAKRVNGRWVASRRKLRELFEGVSADG